MLTLRTFYNALDQKVPEFVSKEESSALSADNLSIGLPGWRQDPSYSWARKGARKRRL